MSNRGVVYIAYGHTAQIEANMAIGFGHGFHGLPIRIIGDNSIQAYLASDTEDRPYWQAARRAKVALYDLSPFDQTLYVDADTRIQGDVSVGFKLLDDGYDLVIIPSANQGSDVLWNVAADERQLTFEEVGFRTLQLQAGVMWFRKSDATRQFFAAWAKEWARFEGQDQAAFTRALVQSPVKVWLLGRPFNGGAVIQHWFGACR